MHQVLLQILHMVSMLLNPSGLQCYRCTSKAETTLRTGGTCQTCRYHLQSSSSVQTGTLCASKEWSWIWLIIFSSEYWRWRESIKLPLLFRFQFFPHMWEVTEQVKDVRLVDDFVFYNFSSLNSSHTLTDNIAVWRPLHQWLSSTNSQNIGMMHKRKRGI